MSENQINFICSSFSFIGLKVKSWKNKHVSWKLLALGIAGISCLYMTCRLVSEPADFSYAAVNIFYGCQYRQQLLCHLQTWAWFKLLDMLKINYLLVGCFCRFWVFCVVVILGDCMLLLKWTELIMVSESKQGRVWLI